MSRPVVRNTVCWTSWAMLGGLGSVSLGVSGIEPIALVGGAGLPFEHCARVEYGRALT